MIKKKSGRQEVISAEIAFVAADISGTTFHPAIELPPGARVIGGELITTSAGQATLTVDVGDSASGNRYGNDLDIDNTGRIALTPTGYVTTAVSDVGVSFSAQPTQGAWTLALQYVVTGRAAFSQGLDYRAAGVRGA